MSLPPTRRMYAVLLAALWWAGCAGCGSEPSEGSASDAEGPHRGGQVVVALTSDINGINNLIVPASVTTTELLHQLFLPLVSEQPDSRTIEPALAESWEFSDDRRELTFHLRDDVLWSDGTPVTAEDVAFTFSAWTSPEVGWETASMVAAIDRVEVVDPHTARFHFNRVYAGQLLDAATLGVILPKHAWGALPFAEWRQSADWFRDHLVVDGPFTFASWTPQQEIVLERNPLYYRSGLPYLDRVVLRVVPEQTNQATQLLNGQADLVVQLSPESAERVEEASDVELHPYWTRGYIAIAWNLRRDDLADARLRRALTHGIDRETLVESIWGSFARPLSGPIPPDVWLYDDSLEPLDYDPEAARRLLAEAGWTDGDGDGTVDKDGRPLRLRLLTNSGNQQREDAAVLIQEQLGRVGIDVVADLLEFNTMIAQAQRGDFDGLLFGITLPTSFDLSYAVHSDAIESGTNLAGFSNPEADRLADEIRQQPTLDAAQPLYDRLQRLLRDEQPYTFLWQSQRLVGARARVRGVDPNHLFTLWGLDEWWVDDAR